MRPLVLCALALLGASPALAAEVFEQAGPSERGRIDFIYVGASMTQSAAPQNGVKCLEEAATTSVAAAELPARPRLLKAVLYVGGSLIDDGVDYPPSDSIFDNGGLVFDNSGVGADNVIIEENARLAADKSVSFRPPGAASAVTVTSSAQPYVSVLYKNAGGEQGNVAFFVTPIDVTDAINIDGGGVLAGPYTVSDLRADVCLHGEAVCEGNPSTTSCGELHTNGAASFALLLIIEDQSLPLRSITRFEGLFPLAYRVVDKRLTLTNPVSSPAAGSLAFYALEGDLMLPQDPTFNGYCQADESIEVDGDENPNAAGLCLIDDDNPRQNVFNGTINGQPRAPVEPACTYPDLDDPHHYQGCCGDGLCGVVGTDIDRFNISGALVPGATDIRVTLRSGQDQVYLASVVLGVDVFQPLLEEDSQIRVLSPTREGYAQLGANIVYSIAVSNTGNVPATEVALTMDAPTGTTDMQILAVPAGALDASSPTGGEGGNGLVDVSGFSVQAGEVAEVRVSLRATCATGTRLAPTVEVTSRETSPLTLSAPVLGLSGPGSSTSECAAIDPDGVFSDDVARDERDLRGGGGCAAGGGSLLFALLVMATLLWRQRRGALLALALVAVAAESGCGKRHTVPGDAPPGSHVITSLDGLPGDKCDDVGLRLYIGRADGSRFCIDRFEASLGSGAVVDEHKAGGDDNATATNGTTQAEADVVLQRAPSTGLTWYQAKGACERAGKRLCTAAEWERACRGPGGLVYPYGDTLEERACNGFFAYTGERPATTGSWDTCGSAFGVYDMSGNVEEWTDTPAERVAGTGTLNDRAVRGGSFNGNYQSLACSGPEFHAAPGTGSDDRGFRCCSDGPI